MCGSVPDNLCPCIFSLPRFVISQPSQSIYFLQLATIPCRFSATGAIWELLNSALEKYKHYSSLSVPNPLNIRWKSQKCWSPTAGFWFLSQAIWSPASELLEKFASAPTYYANDLTTLISCQPFYLLSGLICWRETIIHLCFWHIFIKQQREPVLLMRSRNYIIFLHQSDNRCNTVTFWWRYFGVQHKRIGITQLMRLTS